MKDSIRPRIFTNSLMTLVSIIFLTFLHTSLVNSQEKKGSYRTVPMLGTYFEEQDVDLYDTVAPLIFKIKKPDWLDQFPLFLGYPCNTDKYAESTLCPIFYYMHKTLAAQLSIAMEVPSMNLPVTDMDVNFDCDQISKHFMSFRLKESKMSFYLEKLRKCTEKRIWEGEINPQSLPGNNFPLVYDQMVNRFKQEYHNRLPTSNRENKASELNNRIALTSIAYSHLLALGDRWASALSECKAGFIPDTLISTANLTEALTALENNVGQEIYNYKFSIPFAGPQVSRYYKSPLADCVMTESHLYIRVLVPILKKRISEAALIKIKSVPFHSQTDVHKLCMIKGFEQGRYFNLGVQQTGSIKTSQAMEVTCDTLNFHLCKIPAPLDNVVDSDTDCARALITYDFTHSEDTSNVIAACSLDCINLAVDKFPIVVKSKDASNTVFIIMNPDNNDGFFLECQKKDDSMAIKPSKTGVLAVQIPCRCKVVLKSMEVHPVMATCKEDFGIANAIPFHWAGQNMV